jgi:hypothetical protein
MITIVGSALFSPFEKSTVDTRFFLPLFGTKDGFMQINLHTYSLNRQIYNRLIKSC